MTLTGFSLRKQVHLFIKKVLVFLPRQRMNVLVIGNANLIKNHRHQYLGLCFFYVVTV